MQGYDDVIRFLASKGAKLDTADNDGFTPLDVALGKAGGFGFTGNEGVVREATAALLRELMAAQRPGRHGRGSLKCSRAVAKAGIGSHSEARRRPAR